MRGRSARGGGNIRAGYHRSYSQSQRTSRCEEGYLRVVEECLR